MEKENFGWLDAWFYDTLGKRIHLQVSFGNPNRSLVTLVKRHYNIDVIL